MPKNNKKKLKSNKQNTKNASGDENSEIQADENASTISNASTNMSYQDLDSVEDQLVKPKGEEIFEKIDNIEEQLNTCFDNMLEKGFKEREDSLKILKKMFSNKYLIDHLVTKRFTLCESLLKSLKKGKTAEQLLACDVLSLTFVQFGAINTDVVTILSESRKLLLELIEDEKAEPEVRAACCKTLGMGIYCTNENWSDSVPILDKFESIFSNSYAKGDGTLRTFAPKLYELHAAALSTWCLLLCSMPLHYVNKLSQKHIVHFQDFLKSSDVDLRITAGETIAFLFELAQCDSHSDLSCFEDENLIEILNNLANDPAKYRSKKDKKQQRSSFRDILKTIEQGEFDSQVIKFGSESLYLDNWARRKQYETLKELIGSGMNSHLTENEFIRDLFELSSPLASNQSTRKMTASMTKKEKVEFNKDQFRNRTKSMNKKRENKEAGGGEDDDF